MNNYELTLIVKQDLESRFDIFKESFDKSLSEMGFKIAHIENIGKRFLAYPIQKNNKGLYIIYQLIGAPSSVSDLENKLKYDNSLLRYLLQRVDSHSLSNSFLTQDTIEANKRAEAKLANKAKQDALEAQAKKSAVKDDAADAFQSPKNDQSSTKDDLEESAQFDEIDNDEEHSSQETEKED
ncbi:MAG: 30S ribosomal protein S6 [Gammaproteobacteria bacterium]